MAAKGGATFHVSRRAPLPPASNATSAWPVIFIIDRTVRLTVQCGGDLPSRTAEIASLTAPVALDQWARKRIVPVGSIRYAELGRRVHALAVGATWSMMASSWWRGSAPVTRPSSQPSVPKTMSVGMLWICRRAAVRGLASTLHLPNLTRLS